MKKLAITAFAAWIVHLCPPVEPTDTVFFEHWDILSLEEIGGHGVTVYGDPLIVSTDLGDAVEFDGVEDQLIVDFNPLKDATAFTIELIFWPAASYPDNKEPRFFHIQDPEDPQQKRVMIELRINGNNQCYMDGFMKTDLESLTLIDETQVHPVETWHHVALTYQDSTLRTYFNGIEELSGTCRYTGALVNPTGKTSLGARMNKVAYFAGRMKTVKISHSCLEPSDFLSILDTTGTSVPEMEFGKDDQLQVFPNPVDKILHLECSMDPGPGILRLVDLSGKTLYRAQFVSMSGFPNTLNTSGLEDGVYSLSLEWKSQISHRRIVIIHQN